MGISIVLSSKKEEDNLKKLLPLIEKYAKELNEEYEIIVVDSNPTCDNTEEVCKKFNVKYIKQEEPYFGGARRTGIKYAVYDKYLVMDSDGSHPPEKIPELYNAFVENDCDIAIGSRYIAGGKNFDNFTSIIMSKLLNNTYRFCLGIKTRELSTGFRIYKTELLKKLSLKCKYFDLMEEVIVKMRILKPDLKIIEIPIEFRKRDEGTSKRNLPVFIFYFVKTLIELYFLQLKTCFLKKIKR